MKPYGLEVYQAGSAEDVLFSLESDRPFLTISVGDLINPMVVQGHAGLLRVHSVEHILWQGDGGVKHKVCVYTHAADNDPETRLHP